MACGGYVVILLDVYLTCWTMSGQQGNYSFPPMLFTDRVGNSLSFVIKPCKDKETLRAMIEVCVPTCVRILGNTDPAFLWFAL